MSLWVKAAVNFWREKSCVNGSNFIVSFIQYDSYLGLYPGALSAKWKMPKKIIKAHGVKPSRKKPSNFFFEHPGGHNLSIKKLLFELCNAL